MIVRRLETLGLGTKQRGVGVKKKSMLISSALTGDSEDGRSGPSANMGHSRRGGRYEGKMILLWQQSRLKSSLAVPATFRAIYICLCRYLG